VDLLIGAELVEQASQRADQTPAGKLASIASALRKGGVAGKRQALSPELAQLMDEWGERRFITTYDKELEVIVDTELARFSAWYELFPRSFSAVPRQHGTFKDIEERMLPYVASMGFDILYLPPIHPIGASFRKGPNNTTEVRPR
jgi:starch synthase (maltosyl-transferring)